MECPFYIKLRATLDGTKLYVKEMNDKHNHELLKVGLFVFLYFCSNNVFTIRRFICICQNSSVLIQKLEKK